MRNLLFFLFIAFILSTQAFTQNADQSEHHGESLESVAVQTIKDLREFTVKSGEELYKILKQESPEILNQYIAYSVLKESSIFLFCILSLIFCLYALTNGLKSMIIDPDNLNRFGRFLYEKDCETVITVLSVSGSLIFLTGLIISLNELVKLTFFTELWVVESVIKNAKVIL